MLCKCKDIFTKINLGNQFVFFCLLIFVILLSLRLDNVILWSYGLVFIPIWIWNCVFIIGFIVGSAVWCKKRNINRFDTEQRTHCCSLILSSILLSVLFLGEILIVAAADTGAIPWRAAFTPLYLLAILSASFCFWAILKNRSCEMETLSVFAFIQAIVLGTRLDGLNTLSYTVTLIPTWISIVVLVVFVILYSICVPILSRERWLDPERQTEKAVFPFCIITALCILFLGTLSLILLMVRVDARVAIPFGVIFLPLDLCALCLMINDVTRRWPGNPLWCGFGEHYGDILLQKCPKLQELVNISYIGEDLLPPSSSDVATEKPVEKKPIEAVGDRLFLDVPD